eukprot:403363556
MNYDIQYDIGEYEPLPIEWIDPENFEEEPLPAIKDVQASLSVPDDRSKPIVLPNLYPDANDPEVFLKAIHDRKQYIKDLQQTRKGHLVIKHGSANVVGSVGEPWASEGVVQIKDPRAVEADDELAMKIREEKNNQRLKMERIAKEEKDKIIRDKQRAVEIENLNKELDRGTYTYDFEGHVILQNSQVADQIPADFKFKYRFKKGRGKGTNKKQHSRSQVVPFKDNKATGFQPVDSNKLAKLVDNKQQMQNVRQTAGSMFDFFKPPDAGVVIKEDKKFKGSKKEFDEITGKMSLDNYQKKINVKYLELQHLNIQQDGNFLSSMIHPELQLNKEEQELQQTYQKAPLLQQLAMSLKTNIASKVQEYKDQQEFIQKMRQDFERGGTGPGKRGKSQKNMDQQYFGNFDVEHNMPNDNDKHFVVLKSPESLSQLIVFPSKPENKMAQTMQSFSNQNRSSFIGNNANSTIASLKNKSAISQKHMHHVPVKVVKTQEITNDLFKYKQQSQSQVQMATYQDLESQQKGMFTELNEQILTQNAWGHNNDGLPTLKTLMMSQSQKGFNQNSNKGSNVGTPSARNKNNIMSPSQNKMPIKPQTQQQNFRLNTATHNNLNDRPFSRTSIQSSQQSLRGSLTTANSNHRTQRRNIFSFKGLNGLLGTGGSLTGEFAQNHLPPPPLGKTTGHGLLSGQYMTQSIVSINQKHQSGINSEMASQINTQRNTKDIKSNKNNNFQQSTFSNSVAQAQKQNANHLFNQIGIKTIANKTVEKYNSGGDKPSNSKSQFDNFRPSAGSTKVYDVQIEQFD